MRLMLLKISLFAGLNLVSAIGVHAQQLPFWAAFLPSDIREEFSETFHKFCRGIRELTLDEIGENLAYDGTAWEVDYTPGSYLLGGLPGRLLPIADSLDKQVLYVVGKGKSLFLSRTRQLTKEAIQLHWFRGTIQDADSASEDFLNRLPEEASTVSVINVAHWRKKGFIDAFRALAPNLQVDCKYALGNVALIAYIPGPEMSSIKFDMSLIIIPSGVLSMTAILEITGSGAEGSPFGAWRGMNFKRIEG